VPCRARRRSGKRPPPGRAPSSLRETGVRARHHRWPRPALRGAAADRRGSGRCRFRSSYAADGPVVPSGTSRAPSWCAPTARIAARLMHVGRPRLPAGSRAVNGCAPIKAWRAAAQREDKLVMIGATHLGTRRTATGQHLRKGCGHRMGRTEAAISTRLRVAQTAQGARCGLHNARTGGRPPRRAGAVRLPAGGRRDHRGAGRRRRLAASGPGVPPDTLLSSPPAACRDRAHGHDKRRCTRQDPIEILFARLGDRRRIALRDDSGPDDLHRAVARAGAVTLRARASTSRAVRHSGATRRDARSAGPSSVVVAVVQRRARFSAWGCGRTSGAPSRSWSASGSSRP